MPWDVRDRSSHPFGGGEWHLESGRGRRPRGRPNVGSIIPINYDGSWEATRLKVTFQGVRPPIWRRFQVPGEITLDRLDLVLKAVMGWGGRHLHMFEVGDRRIGEPDDSYGDSVDDWRHQILVEKDGLSGCR